SLAMEQNIKKEFGLGRVLAVDARDEGFSMRPLLSSRKKLPTYKYWNANGWWGDQGSLPHCVGFSWAHWLEDGPVTHKGNAPIVNPSIIYKEAQKVDEWPGEKYDGTSVRAGAKILHKQGLIESYYWAWDIDSLANAVLTLGPVVVGTNWYD